MGLGNEADLKIAPDRLRVTLESGEGRGVLSKRLQPRHRALRGAHSLGHGILGQIGASPSRQHLMSQPVLQGQLVVGLVETRAQSSLGEKGRLIVLHGTIFQVRHWLTPASMRTRDKSLWFDKRRGILAPESQEDGLMV
jgi:hypothetical protein